MLPGCNYKMVDFNQILSSEAASERLQRLHLGGGVWWRVLYIFDLELQIAGRNRLRT